MGGIFPFQVVICPLQVVVSQTGWSELRIER